VSRKEGRGEGGAQSAFTRQTSEHCPLFLPCVSCSYSVVSNQMCNVCNGVVQPGAGPGQLKVTQDEYNALVFAHLTELWGNFGPLAEVW
jgi:hypothetical protein